MPLTYDKTIREGESHSGLLENKLGLCQGGVDLTLHLSRIGWDAFLFLFIPERESCENQYSLCSVGSYSQQLVSLPERQETKENASLALIKQNLIKQSLC